jgi:hypothetical protein
MQDFSGRHWLYRVHTALSRSLRVPIVNIGDLLRGHSWASTLLRTRVIRTHPLARPPLDVPSPRVFPAEVSPAHALEALHVRALDVDGDAEYLGGAPGAPACDEGLVLVSLRDPVRVGEMLCDATSLGADGLPAVVPATVNHGGARVSYRI